MKLRTRLILLTVLLILLPALPAMWVTRHLVEQSLNLGLSPEIANALEAGIRQTRATYQDERTEFEAEVASWVATGAAPEDAPGRLVDPNDPTGSENAPAQDAPPREIVLTKQDASGRSFTVARALSPEWRGDAASLAASLQMVRGLQAERNELANRFWLPFLAIYGITLLIAFGAAAWLGRGITNPILRLADATREVSRGRWDVRVDADRTDEVGQLGAAFNRMVETLDAQSRQLVELEKMAGWREMARALAHEVKNPLTPIRLTVEEMGSRYRGDDPDYRKLLDECTRIVVREVESLRNIVTRFREFSRPVELVWESVALNEIVTEIGSLQRDMEVTYDLDPNVAELIGDPDRTRQALMNLARNAQEAMRGQSEPRLHLATRRDGDAAVILVDDNGPGIPEEERSRVFEPYRSGKADGLGLGLTLVKGIVLAHGGTIEAQDSSLGGARFRIVLPLHGVDGDKGPTPADGGTAESGAGEHA